MLYYIEVDHKPAKPGERYRAYVADESQAAAEARLLAAIQCSRPELTEVSVRRTTLMSTSIHFL